METRQAPLLRYKDITLTTEYLKECLTAVCPLLGVHNVARVRQGALPLFEVDFMDEKALSVKCCLTVCTTSSCMYTADNSHNIPGEIQARLQDQLERNIFDSKQKAEVTLKLHMIMPNADKKFPVSREVTTINYQECFSLIKESAMFEFRAFNIAHEIVTEETSQQELVFGEKDVFLTHSSCTCMFYICSGIDDVRLELTEMAAHWFTVGLFLKIA